MNFTLITSTGRVMTFFILTVAQQYQSAYGGTIVTATVLDTVAA